MISGRQAARILESTKPVRSILESRFGLILDDLAPEHLESVIAHYVGKRNHLLLTLGEAIAITKPEYAKAVLISETARIILREIMPINLRRKRTPKDKK